MIRCAQSLVMDGTTAHVKMDSLLTKMDIHAMVGCVYVHGCACALFSIVLFFPQISMSAPLMVQHSVNLLAVTVITHLVAITAHVRKAIISMSNASYALVRLIYAWLPPHYLRLFIIAILLQLP